LRPTHGRPPLPPRPSPSRFALRHHLQASTAGFTSSGAHHAGRQLAACACRLCVVGAPAAVHSRRNTQSVDSPSSARGCRRGAGAGGGSGKGGWAGGYLDRNRDGLAGLARAFVRVRRRQRLLVFSLRRNMRDEGGRGSAHSAWRARTPRPKQL
jgi:hypothetical protein